MTFRLTGQRPFFVQGIRFRQAFGTPGGLRIEPGAVNYAVYFWVSQPLSDIVITKNHGRSTYTATAGGRVVGRRYYTVTNAAAAGVRALRKSLTTGDSQ